MTAEPVADPESLPGRELHDQLGRSIGTIEEVVDTRDGDEPRWVTVQVKPGAFGTERVVVPLARIKEEDGQLEMPYSDRHILDAPRPDDPSAMDDDIEQELLAYYGVERGDQPDVDSYSTQGTTEIDPDDIGEPVGDPEDEGEEAANADRGQPADASDDDRDEENDDDRDEGADDDRDEENDDDRDDGADDDTPE